MGMAVYTDSSKIPTRVLRIEDSVDAANFKGIPDVFALDDSKEDVLILYKQISELKAQGIPDIYIAFDGKFRVMDDVEKAEVDADIALQKKLEQDASIKAYDDFFLDIKPTDLGLTKVYGLIDSLTTIDDIKTFLKRHVAFTIKRTTTI